MDVAEAEGAGGAGISFLGEEHETEAARKGNNHRGGGGIGEMKSRFAGKMEDVKGKMDEVKDRMEEARGNIQANNVKGAVILSKFSEQSGNQLITHFLKMSMSSSKSRREKSSEATTQMVQTLLLQHSRSESCVIWQSLHA
eukprot:scaffold183289_cov46-Prasinocladus_malaysianus.AAC.1